MKKSEPVEKILKRYKNEWLLIDLDKVDERTLKPKTGRLIQHSASKDDLSQTLITHTGRVFIVFSGPMLPAGFQAAF